MALTIRVFNEGIPDQFCSFPQAEGTNKNGYDYFEFEIPGIEFQLLVGSQIPQEDLCPMRHRDRPIWIHAGVDAKKMAGLSKEFARLSTAAR